MALKLANFAAGFVSRPISAAATSITLTQGGSLFPTLGVGDYFYVVLTDSLAVPSKTEIVKVTAHSGNGVFTMTRGQDGTVATAFDFAYVLYRVVRQTLLDISSGAAAGALLQANNLSDLANTETARDNIGVGVRAISVHAYGAVGDYVPSTGAGTNDSTAINNALTAAKAIAPCEVWLQPGKKYKLDATITIPVGVTLKAPGGGPASGFQAFVPYSDPAFFPSTDLVAATCASYSVNAGTDVITWVGHPFANNDRAVFADGVNGDVTAPGITNGQRYYIINVAGNNFQISATSGGLAVNITGANGAQALIFKITSAGGNGIDFRNMGGSLWVCFDAGRGDGTPTYDVTDAVGLPNYPTRTAAIYVRGALENVNVFQYSFANGKISTYTDTSLWNSAWNSGLMSGLAIRLDADDAIVKRCFIGGFMQAILCYLEDRGECEDLLIDCMNGVEVASSFDIQSLENIHCFPFASIGYSLSSIVRRGTAIYLHDTVDWARVSSCFSYGFKGGITLSNIGNPQLDNCGCDGTSLETIGHYGLRLLGANVQNLSVSGLTVANKEFGVYADIGSANQATFTGLTSSSCNTGFSGISGYRATILGGYFSAPGSGTRIGINNSGISNFVLINPAFVNCLANQYGCTVYRESFTRRTLTRNQGMTVAQYGASAALTAAFAYACVDMWAFRQDTAAAGIAAQVNLPVALSRFVKCAQMGRTAASALTNVIRGVYCLHSVECLPYAGRTLTATISLLAGANFSAAANAISFQIQSGTGTNESPATFVTGFAGSSYVVNSTVTGTPGAWTTFEITFIAPANCNQLGISVSYTPSGVAGADDNLYFTGVRIENAQQATPYEPMLPADALAECTDIACKSFVLTTAPVAGTGAGTGETTFIAGKAGATAQFSHRIQYPRRMIAVPTTIYLYNPVTGASAQVRNFTAAADLTATAVANSTDSGFNITATGSAGTVVGDNLGLHWLATCAL